MVPVIVNAILNEHQIIVDIVAFVNKGDFPRSRLGEKQRGKILAGWVSRKMRTMAQFAIKDMHSAVLGPPGTSSGEPGPTIPNVAEDMPRGSMGSFRSSGGGPMYPFPGISNLRNVEHAPHIMEQRELEQEAGAQHPYHTAPAQFGPAEMPADEKDIDPEQTPTKNTKYSNRVSVAALPHGYDLPDFDRFGSESEDNAAPPMVGPKPTNVSVGSPPTTVSVPPQGPPQIRLPGVDGRESLDDWDLRPGSMVQGGTGTAGGGGSGRATNDDDDWTRDAYMSMNLAGTLGRSVN